jgi:hypothetical protein
MVDSLAPLVFVSGADRGVLSASASMLRDSRDRNDSLSVGKIGGIEVQIELVVYRGHAGSFRGCKPTPPRWSKMRCARPLAVLRGYVCRIAISFTLRPPGRWA